MAQHELAQLNVARLRAHGPTAHAFSFRKLFPAPDAAPATEAASFGDACPAT